MSKLQTSTASEVVPEAHVTDGRFSLWHKGKSQMPKWQISLAKVFFYLMFTTLFILSPLWLQLYQPALWQGYSLHLRHFSPVNIINITDLDHFMACFFPEGLDKDPDSVAMKVCSLGDLKRVSLMLDFQSCDRWDHVMSLMYFCLSVCV